MAKLYNAGTGTDGQTMYWFHCPGCECSHGIAVPRWTWNGSIDAPTFSPSVFVFPHGTAGGRNTPRCHSFVKDGRIEFLGDCEHRLAGQTVDIPDWDGWQTEGGE